MRPLQALYKQTSRPKDLCSSFGEVLLHHMKQGNRDLFGKLLESYSRLGGGDEEEKKNILFSSDWLYNDLFSEIITADYELGLLEFRIKKVRELEPVIKLDKATRKLFSKPSLENRQKIDLILQRIELEAWVTKLAAETEKLIKRIDERQNRLGELEKTLDKLELGELSVDILNQRQEASQLETLLETLLKNAASSEVYLLKNAASKYHNTEEYRKLIHEPDTSKSYFHMIMSHMTEDDFHDCPETFLYRVIFEPKHLKFVIPSEYKVMLINCILEKYKELNAGETHKILNHGSTKVIEIEQDLFSNLDLDILKALSTGKGQVDYKIDLSSYLDQITGATKVTDTEVEKINFMVENFKTYPEGHEYDNFWDYLFNKKLKQSEINDETILKWATFITSSANEQFKSDNATYLRGVIQSKLEELMLCTSENEADIVQLFELFDCIKERHGAFHAVRPVGNIFMGKSNWEKIEDLRTKFEAERAASDGAASGGAAEDSTSNLKLG